MFKRFTALALTLLLIGSLSSCIFDPKPTPVDNGGGGNTHDYLPLDKKVNVLFNLQQAYNYREIDPYKALLDPNDFVFFFEPGDVGGPDNIPASWGYSEEVASATNMFNKGGGQKDNPILSITLELVDYDKATWTEFDPTGQPGVYETFVSYIFSIDTENETTYVTTGNERAQFRVRQDGNGLWHLVQWNDLRTN